MKQLLQFMVQVLFLSLLAVLPSYSQIDSSLGFFALHNGDVRQYHFGYYIYCYNQTYSSYYTERVIGDTLISNGLTYKIVETNRAQPPPRRLLRVDTATANVYEYSGSPSSSDYLVDSLRATVGSVFRRGNCCLMQCVGVDTATLLGIRTIVKRFNALITGAGWTYSLAYGFGFARNVSSEEDPCYPVWNSFVTDLCYARISGQEYGTFVGVKNEGETAPRSFALRQNYPNPFNPNTTIRYNLPRACNAKLSVYNIVGQQVETLVDKQQQAGYYEVSFRPDRMASGVFFYRLQAGDFTETKKMLVLR